MAQETRMRIHSWRNGSECQADIQAPWISHLGWLLPLLLLLSVLLLTSFSAASADPDGLASVVHTADSSEPRAWGQSDLALAPPQTVTLAASPDSILADGTATSTLTATVQATPTTPVDDGTVIIYSTTLGTFPGGLMITPAPTGVMTVEAESTTVVATGAWVTYTEPNASGGQVIYSNVVSDKVSYEFTGTAISVILQKQWNAGIVRVYVDGALFREIDTYWDDAPPHKLFQQEEVIATDLAYAPHTVEVEVSATKNVSATDTFAVVDAFRVYGYDQNGSYLTSGGFSTITLTSAVTPTTAEVTACAGAICAQTPITLQAVAPGYTYLYLPMILRSYPLPPLEGCEELIQNGGFEDDTTWSVGVTSRPARFGSEQAYEGQRSVLLGIKSGEEDILSYSSVRQPVSLPANATSALFGFWYFPISELDDGDRQECLLLDEDDHLLATLMRTNLNDAAWIKKVYDVSAYAGRTIKVYCNAYNDGDGTGVTGFYLDDVSVYVCAEGAVTPEPPTPEPPTPEPPTPEPPDCYPAQLNTTGVGQAPRGVAVNSAANRVYVANHEDDTLSVIDSTTYGQVGTVPVGDGPNSIAHSPASDKIYVTNGGGNSVTVLRASDLGLVKTIAVGSSPLGLAVNQVTNRIYVANSGNDTVSIIDGSTDTVLKTVPVGPGPMMVAVDSIANKAFVSLNGTDKVAVIDGAGQVTQVSTFSGGGYGITVDTLRHLVYVSTIDTYRIVVLDGLNGSFLGWAEIRRAPGDEPVPLRMIAVNPLIGSSGHIFVTTAGEDGGWNKFLHLPKGWSEQFGRAHALDLNEPRSGMAFEPTTMRVFVTSHSDDLLAVYWDGEPSCPSNFFAWSEYQVTICEANPDGTCRTAIRR